MAGRIIQFTDAQSQEIGEVHPGYTGRWIVQVTAITGVTLIPEISIDRAQWDTKAVTPANGTADVTSITTVGCWIFESLTALARLRSTGLGSATVRVLPAIG